MDLVDADNMDPFIVSNPPQSSPMLAYGTARKPGWSKILLAFVVGSFLLILLVGGILWALFSHVTLPTDRMLEAALTPHKIYSQLNPALRHDLPAPWRVAIETRSRFPAVLGLAMDDENHPRAFALVSRTAVIVPGAGYDVVRHGPTILLIENGSQTETQKLHQLLPVLRRALGHDLAFALRGDLFAGLVHEHTTDQKIFGTWDGTIGRMMIETNASSDRRGRETESRQETGGIASLFAVLGQEPEDASPVIAGLLHQGVDLREVSQTPRVVALDPTRDPGLTLRWDEALDPAEAARVLAAQGLAQQDPYTLPDAIVVSELRYGSATNGEIGITPVAFGSASGSDVAPTTPSDETSACPGTLRFSLTGRALKAVLASWGASSFWQDTLESITIAEEQKNANICIKTLDS